MPQPWDNGADLLPVAGVEVGSQKEFSSTISETAKKNESDGIGKESLGFQA
jgi:hypothetical protein